MPETMFVACAQLVARPTCEGNASSELAVGCVHGACLPEMERLGQRQIDTPKFGKKVQAKSRQHVSELLVLRP